MNVCLETCKTVRRLAERLNCLADLVARISERMRELTIDYQREVINAFYIGVKGISHTYYGNNVKCIELISHRLMCANGIKETVNIL